ncbi:MAG: hypothetical protein ACPLRA_05005, partial [Candidatus Saccharicenans sp.]
LNYGLGILIKEFQREVLLEVFHLGTVVCTFDPLTAVNAYRNIRHFRMEVLEYRVAPYGEYGGRLNRQDVPSDRFFMSWDLKKRPKPLVPDNQVLDYIKRLPQAIVISYENFQSQNNQVVLEKAVAVELGLGSELILVQIPADYYLMLNFTAGKEPEVRQIPIDWRYKTREVFLNYLRKGYRVADFLRSGTEPLKCYYLLQRSK